MLVERKRRRPVGEHEPGEREHRGRDHERDGPSRACTRGLHDDERDQRHEDEPGTRIEHLRQQVHRRLRGAGEMRGELVGSEASDRRLVRDIVGAHPEPPRHGSPERVLRFTC